MQPLLHPAGPSTSGGVSSCRLVRDLSRSRSNGAGVPSLSFRMLWRVSSRPIRTRSKPPGFILPCQPALAGKPPSGPGWLHEIKFDGYRVIARKDGDQVRLWARTTSDYSKAFTRIRDAVAALPVESAVLDGEAIVLRPDNTSDFEGLRSRQGQAEAILVAYDIMEADGQDLRPEPLEERRKGLAKLLSRKNKAMRHGIQLSEG